MHRPMIVFFIKPINFQSIAPIQNARKDGNIVLPRVKNHCITRTSLKGIECGGGFNILSTNC